MKNWYAVLLTCAWLGCVDGEPNPSTQPTNPVLDTASKTSAPPSAPPIKKESPEQTSIVESSPSSAPAAGEVDRKPDGGVPSENTVEAIACAAERKGIEEKFQAALTKRAHRACTKDGDCVYLPAQTECSDAICLTKQAGVNKQHAKDVKAIQYEADLRTCYQLTQTCASEVHAARSSVRCAAPDVVAFCAAGVCQVRDASKKRVTPTATKVAATPKLTLGETKSDVSDYKPTIRQSLLAGRNAAFYDCKSYAKGKSGSATFEFGVTSRGTLGRLRKKSSSLPDRMSRCLLTWLKGHTYPVPSAPTLVTQRVHYSVSSK